LHLTIGLGTDEYLTDMFDVIRATFLIHERYLQDACVMPAETVLDIAKIKGAEAAGLGDSRSVLKAFQSHEGWCGRPYILGSLLLIEVGISDCATDKLLCEKGVVQGELRPGVRSRD